MPALLKESPVRTLLLLHLDGSLSVQPRMVDPAASPTVSVADQGVLLVTDQSRNVATAAPEAALRSGPADGLV